MHIQTLLDVIFTLHVSLQIKEVCFVSSLSYRAFSSCPWLQENAALLCSTAAFLAVLIVIYLLLVDAFACPAPRSCTWGFFIFLMAAFVNVHEFDAHCVAKSPVRRGRDDWKTEDQYYKTTRKHVSSLFAQCCRGTHNALRVKYHAASRAWSVRGSGWAASCSGHGATSYT